MGIGLLTLDLLSRCPAATRFGLRQYLHRRLPVPHRTEWVIEELKRRCLPNVSPTRVRLSQGLIADFDLKNPIASRLYYHGTCEEEVWTFVTNVLRPGMTFLDAGANIGEFSLLASRIVGRTGRVVSLECSPATAERLKHNIALNHLDNVQVVEEALCDSDAMQRFFVGSGCESGASSLTVPHNYSGTVVEVRGTRIDTLVRRLGLAAIDCIKLDVEGAELAALRGAEEVLSSDNPPFMLVEYHPDIACRAGWSFENLAELLAKFRYSLFRLVKRGMGASEHRWGNYICVPSVKSLPAMGPFQVVPAN
jgi:FkbM family methyltransferase